jgi:hypothetical protein
MTTVVVPEEGTVLGEFEACLERAMTWRVDWTLGLDVPEYLDPEVARSMGHPDIPVPPGSLVFFAFLGDQSWLGPAGIAYDRSLAVRRKIINHLPLHVGDVITGRTTIGDVTEKRSDTATIVKTRIDTTYCLHGRLAAEESVTYSTKHDLGEPA